MPSIFDDKFGGAPPADERNYLSNLMRSAFSSAGPEFIGMQPMEGVESWRSQNPVAGVLSILGPMAAEYGLGMAAAPRILSTVPKVSEALSWARAPETIAAMPFRAAAAEGALLLAPLEAGRLGGAAIAEGVTDEPQSPLINTLYSAGLDLSLGAVGDVALTALKHSAGRAGDFVGARKLLQNIPGINSEDAPRNIINQLDSAPIDSAQHQFFKREMEGEILAEGATPRNQYFQYDFVGPLRPGEAPPTPRWGPNKVVNSSGFQPISPTSDYNDLFNAVIADSGHPDLNDKTIWQHLSAPVYKEFDAKVGFDGKPVKSGGLVDPQLSAAKTRDMADNFKYKLDSSFENRTYTGVVDQATGRTNGLGTWYQTEPTTGLMTIAKELPGNKFIMFKTDRPSLFAPRGLFTDVNNVRGGIVDTWSRAERDLVDNVSAMRGMNDITKSVLSAPAMGTKGSEFLDSVKRVLPISARENFRAIASKFGGEFNRWFAPTSVQMARNPVAQRLFGINKMFHGQGQIRASELLHGNTTLKNTKLSAAKSLLSSEGIARSGGIDDAVRKMSDNEFIDFVEGLYREPTLEDLNNASWSTPVKETLLKFRNYYKSQADDMQALGRLDGGVAYREDYYGSHLWRGDFRSPIVDQRGRTLYYGSGHTARLANEDAKRLADALRASNIDAEATGRAFVREQNGEFSDIELQRLLPKDSPEYKAVTQQRISEVEQMRRRQFEKVRTGVGGYYSDQTRRGMEGVSWTRQEVIDMIANNIYARERLRSDLAFKSHPEVRRTMARLIANDPTTAKYLSEKIAAEAGQKIGFFKFVDTYADKVLSPILGTNGASKITRAVNRTMYNLMFPVTDIAFPLLNALTGLQTVVPEISFVVDTVGRDPALLQRWYMSAPLITKEGKTIGAFSHIDPVKMWKNGWTKMFDPAADEVYKSDVLLAVKEGVIDPKFFEDFAGSKTEKIRDIFSPSKDRDLAESLLSINEYLPTQSEKIARLQAFTTAWDLGKDVLGISDEGLYQFAREFTNRTMYLYGMSDRPAIFGGAFGGMFGLYKTWMTNFIANMMTYGKEAALRGNFKPLLWMNANTALLAGVTATPAYSLVEGTYDLFSDETLTETLRKQFGYTNGTGEMLDSVFYGLPASLGVTINARATLPGTDVQRDLGQLFSFAVASRAAALAQAAGEGIDHYATTGQLPVNDPRFRQLLANAVLPRSFVRSANVIDGDLTSARTGNTLIPNVGKAAQISAFLGFTPVEWQRAYELSDILYKKTEAMRAQVSSMGEALMYAKTSGDSTTYHNISREAIQLGIWDRVYSSYMARKLKKETPVTERMLSPAKERELRAAYGS